MKITVLQEIERALTAQARDRGGTGRARQLA